MVRLNDTICFISEFTNIMGMSCSGEDDDDDEEGGGEEETLSFQVSVSVPHFWI